LEQIKRTRPGGNSDSEIECKTKIKIADKLKALDSLSRRLGLFERDNVQSSRKDILTMLMETIAGSQKPDELPNLTQPMLDDID
jgi:hypothetical protein